jgi:hypothetical protein
MVELNRQRDEAYRAGDHKGGHRNYHQEKRKRMIAAAERRERERQA